MCACDRALTLVRHIMFLAVSYSKYVLLYFRVLPFLFSSGLVALKAANVVFQGEAFPEIQRNSAEVCNKKQQQQQGQQRQQQTIIVMLITCFFLNVSAFSTLVNAWWKPQALFVFHITIQHTGVSTDSPYRCIH